MVNGCRTFAKKTMKLNTAELIEDLIERTRHNMNTVQQLTEYDDAILNWKAAAESWSVLECIEHLNRYGNFYLPEIELRMKAAPDSTNNNTFKSGWLGNYFARLIGPKEKVNSMKTLKPMNPSGSALDTSVLTSFIEQQKTILDLLQIAKRKNLSRIKTSISISNFIKLRLGDTFRVVIYHNQRHIQQAQRALKAQG